LVATNSFGANQTFTPPTNPPPPIFAGVPLLSAGGLRLTLQGASGLACTLPASTNRRQWSPVTNLTAGLDEQIQFLDTTTNYPTRIFRLRFPKSEILEDSLAKVARARQH
jgi:hypothetical protein